jgi:hypothetical protein
MPVPPPDPAPEPLPDPVPDPAPGRGSAAGPAAGRPAAGRSPGGRRPVALVGIAVLLVVQVVALLLVGSYARADPRLWGFPFFYWYTLLWLGLGAASMAGCVALAREPRELGESGEPSELVAHAAGRQ